MNKLAWPCSSKTLLTKNVVGQIGPMGYSWPILIKDNITNKLLITVIYQLPLCEPNAFHNSNNSHNYPLRGTFFDPLLCIRLTRRGSVYPCLFALRQLNYLETTAPCLSYNDEWQSLTSGHWGVTVLNFLVQRYCLRMIYESCILGFD